MNFMLNLIESFRVTEIFDNFPCYQQFRFGFCLQFLVGILPLGFGSVNPHIYPDPGSQKENVADPTDPDP